MTVADVKKTTEQKMNKSIDTLKADLATDDGIDSVAAVCESEPITMLGLIVRMMPTFELVLSAAVRVTTSVKSPPAVGVPLRVA